MELRAPKTTQQVTKVFDEGGRKHGQFDFEDKSSADDLIKHLEAIERHLAEWRSRTLTDATSGQHPLAHVIARFSIILEVHLRSGGTKFLAPSEEVSCTQDPEDVLEYLKENPGCFDDLTIPETLARALILNGRAKIGEVANLTYGQLEDLLSQ
jgi:hypothetical protein